MNDVFMSTPIAIKRLSIGVATTVLLTSLGIAQALEVGVRGKHRNQSVL